MDVTPCAVRARNQMPLDSSTHITHNIYMEMGICRKCGEDKPLSEVSKSHRIGKNKKSVIYYRQCDSCRDLVLLCRDVNRVSAKLRREIIIAGKGKCASCGRTTNAIDHIIPLCRGGKTAFNNLQLLCPPCNSRKGMKSIDYREKR